MKQQQITTKISKWGNGYAIRVPTALLRALSLSEGSQVVLSQDALSIQVSPKNQSVEHLSLAQLLKRVTPEQLREDHADTFFGVSQGKEVW